MGVSPEILERLGSVDKYDLPWSWDSLTPELVGELSAALVDWVVDYNDNFVTKPRHLIPECWPVHPGLARELAAMYAHWVTVFHSANSLAGTQRDNIRYADRLGRRRGRHPVAERVPAVAAVLDRDRGLGILRLTSTSDAQTEALF